MGSWVILVLRGRWALPALLAAGLLVHLGLIASGLWGVGRPMGDLPYAYEPWINQMFATGRWLGINANWVYPYPALLPMVLAKRIHPQSLQAGWLTLVTVLNLLALMRLSRFGRSSQGMAASWYWLGFLALLGPVAISRIDSISILLAIFGVVAWLQGSSRQASVWFTLGAWMKVWPAALVLALLSKAKDRIPVLIAAAVTSLSILALGLLLGGNLSLLSFITTQNDRGIQIESPAAMWWMWLGVAGVEGAGPIYSASMMTFQVQGEGVVVVGTLLTLALIVAVGITLFLAWRASRSEAEHRELMVVTALTLTLDLIVFNKVGSPQFIGWLAVPILAGMLIGLKKWQVPMILGLALAALTNLIYPVLYAGILSSEFWSTGVLTIRNALELVLLTWANLRLMSLTSRQLR